VSEWMGEWSMYLPHGHTGGLTIALLINHGNHLASLYGQQTETPKEYHQS